MDKEETQRKIQERLAEARRILIEVGRLADEDSIERVDFMGLTYERQFGWFRGEDLQEASEWNHSACVIGSEMAAHGTMDWQSSWC